MSSPTRPWDRARALAAWVGVLAAVSVPSCGRSVGPSSVADASRAPDVFVPDGSPPVADVPLLDAATESDVVYAPDASPLPNPAPCAGCAPRPVVPAPSSVTSLTPTFRWVLPPEAASAQLQICATADCAAPEVTRSVVGTTFQVDAPLRAGRHFWRLATDTGGVPASTWSAVWGFEAGASPRANHAGCGERSDFNGDGIPDLAVGEPTLTGTGAVNVYLGSAEGFRAAPDLVLHAPGGDHQFGGQITSTGDVNGDGRGDLLVFTYESYTVRPAYLFYGSAGGLEDTPGAVLVAAAPALESDHEHFPTRRAGDLNGDGFADVVLPSSPSAQGDAAYVWYGRSGALPASADLVLRVPPEALYDWGLFGRFVSGAGDVNGDGYSDLALGSPEVVPGGAVYLYLGGPGGIAARPNEVISNPVPPNDAGTVVSDLGSYLAPAGDVNGDGYADLLASATQESPGGRAYVLLGGAAGFASLVGLQRPDTNTAAWGAVTRCLGDIDGDGFDDVAVSDGYGGQAFVHRGGAGGPHVAPDLVIAAPPGDEAAQFATAIQGLGDLDDDGYGEYVMSASPGANGGFPAAAIFRGGALPGAMPWFTLSDPSAPGFGRSLARVARRRAWPSG